MPNGTLFVNYVKGVIVGWLCMLASHYFRNIISW